MEPRQGDIFHGSTEYPIIISSGLGTSLETWSGSELVRSALVKSPGPKNGKGREAQEREREKRTDTKHRLAQNILYCCNFSFYHSDKTANFDEEKSLQRTTSCV